MRSPLLAAFLTAPLAAQVTWFPQAPTVSPPARDNVTMSFDLLRGRAVLFGGHAAAGGTLADTWEWDGTSWTQAMPALSPPPRQEHPMGYVLGFHTLLFSGWNGATYLGDTWTWDGTAWTQQVTPVGPPPRSHTAMAYDVARANLVLFGGWDWRIGRYGDTWTWSGTSWTQRAPAQSPPARADHALAWDDERGVMVLFGGSTTATGDLNDTWLWDGTNWTQAQPPVSPPARRHHTMTYDGPRGRTVLFGGDTNGAFFADVWEWDGTTWTQRSVGTGPAARSDHAAVADWARARVIVFGGRDSAQTFGDTWEYGTSHVASSTPFGAGCAGTAGTPGIAVGRGEGAWLGESVTVGVVNLPAAPAAVLTLGFSRTRWGGVPLPIDLGPAGAPGCSLATSIALLLPLAPNSVQLALPMDLALLGGHFYDQALVVDPPANGLGLTVSNAVDFTVGIR